MDEFNFLVPADKLTGYGTSSVGGIFARGYGYFKDSAIHNSSSTIDKRGTWCALRDYTGEWGNNTNRKKNNGDATNPANHFNWIAGQRVSKKGKLYEANIDQAWNQFDPETDTNAWQEIIKDIRLPQDAEVLDCLGLNWGVGEGTNAFSYSDRKWSDGTTIRDLPDPFGYYKMISPTTKKMCYITISFNPNTNPGIGIANMCWNDLVARQPELVEVDRFTMRFGTQLYYVRIPTKEEVTLLCAYNNKVGSNAIVPRNVAFCQTPGPGVETVKALSSAGENTPTETDVNVRSRILEICFVLTPIPEGEEPYQTAMLNKLYPNITLPQGNLSWSTENLTEGPDTNYFPAGLKLAYDRFTDTGYFGRVPVGTFKSYKKLMDTYGVSGRTQHYDGTGTNDRDVKFYDMFYYHGLVVYIPNGAPWSNMSFDYCKSQGILFGANMGTYHSYPGDAKLEDSKDNWYRISGMNVNRWNISPHYGIWNAPRKSQWSLLSNDIGYLGNDKSVWSTCYAKILNFTSNPYGSYNTWSIIVPTGNKFTIKDRNVFEARTISSADIGEFTKSVYVGTASGNKIYAFNSVHCLSNNNIATSGLYGLENSLFRPMLTLKPVDPGITNPIILSCQVRAKCIARPYGWDRTMKLTPLYSAYNIKSIELSLNTDARGNLLVNGNKHPNAVMAGIVPPKADETICVEYKTFEQKDSSNEYTLKVTFDNGKILYVTAALVGTGFSYANQDNTDSRIYRLSDLV